MKMRASEERLVSKKKVNIHDKKKHQHPPHPEGGTPVSLGERLRRWAQDHQWYQLGHIRNALALKRAFSKPIAEAVDGFLSQGLIKLAFQAKSDFDGLTERVKRFDERCRQGCEDEDQLHMCEHLREQIHAAIDDLAARLDNRELNNDCPDMPSASPAVPFNSDRWMTFGQAAQILAVSKATISNWTTKGRIRDNNVKGQRRRVLKADVLVVKHHIEMADLVHDAVELREEAQHIARRH
ncbi:MAG: helix-turn-helix domain-containing protein [Phycisphaerae bacterium]|nr:helix-turn-helix domain-containing protein [Phycisphaerae bacterium]